MQHQSSEAVRVPTGSFHPVIRVEAWFDGRLMEGNLPLVDGNLTVTAGQAIRSRLSLTISDSDGFLTPKPGGALCPWGGELHVRAGVMVGPVEELVSLGWFPIMSAETQEQWKDYVLPDEPTRAYMVSRGSIVQVTAVDRAQKVSEARFESREQPPAGATALSEIRRLLQGVVPWRPVTVTDHVVPSDLTYDDDRMGAFVKLATALDCEPVFDPDGAATLIPSVPVHDEPVWSIDTRPNGTMVEFNRTLTRDIAYNAVIVRSTLPNSQVELQGRAILTEGPMRYGGPLGRVPYFASLPVLTTQAAVDKAAVTLMAKLARSRSQSLNVTTVANYALEVGDVIRLQCPRGYILADVVSITYPLTPTTMSLTVTVDPEQLAQVS